MTDAHDDRIKELLDSTAPDRPDVPAAARTSAVRGRAVVVRRRQRLVLAAAVLAVVGVGVGVPVLTSGDGPSREEQVASDPSAEPTSPSTPTPPPCPGEPIDVDDVPTVDALPEGATSVRACPASRAGVRTGDGGAEAQTLPPGPVVGDGAEEFVRAVDALPSYTLEDECALIMVNPVPWTVVVGYPDGTTVTLGTTSQVCAAVPVAGVDRSAEEIVGLYSRASGGDPTGQPDPAADSGDVGCPAYQTGVEATLSTFNTYDGDLADFEPESGVVCDVAGADSEPAYPHPDGLIDSARLGDLVGDLASESTPTPQRAGRCTETGPSRALILADADDRAVALVDNSCTGEYAGRGVYWIPGDAAAQAIQDAMEGAGFQ